MSRSAELFRFIEQLRFTDLVDFIIVWAIIYGLLKLVRGTRAVQMAVGLLGVGLQNYIETGVALNAQLSYDLLVTVFDPHTPLHDGAAIIRSYKVAAASCFLPLTLNPRLSKELGTRHRAAIGITEDTDAAAVVVSEETGIISFVERGEITRYLNSAALRERLREALEPTGGISEIIRPRRRARRSRKRESARESVSESFIK